VTPRTKKPVSEFSPGGMLTPSEAPRSRFQESENDPEFWKAYFRFPQHDLAEAILELRRHRGMTQAELARLVGTQQPAIARIEAARSNVGLATIRAIGVALDAVVRISMTPAEECVPRFLMSQGDASISADEVCASFAAERYSGEMRCLGPGAALSTIVESPDHVANNNFALSA